MSNAARGLWRQRLWLAQSGALLASGVAIAPALAEEAGGGRVIEEIVVTTH